MLHIISSLVVLLIGLGLYFRRNPLVHVRLMTCAFVIDLSLVLWIEATRHAVEKVAHRVSPLLYFHAAVSLAVLICYIVMIVLGRRVLQGSHASRSTHRNLGMTFAVLRSLNYVTALML